MCRLKMPSNVQLIKMLVIISTSTLNLIHLLICSASYNPHHLLLTFQTHVFSYSQPQCCTFKTSVSSDSTQGWGSDLMLWFRKCPTLFFFQIHMYFVLIFVATANTWQNRECYCSTKLLKIEAYRKQWTMTVAWPANGSSSLFSLFFSSSAREDEERNPRKHMGFN